MKLFVSLVLTLLFSTGLTFAVMDPSPDSLCMYLDLDATTPGICEIPDGFEPIEAYLCITKPSNRSGVKGWQVTINEGFDWSIAPTVEIENGLDVDSDPYRYEVGVGSPIMPQGDVVHLATFRFYVFGSHGDSGYFTAENAQYIAESDYSVLIDLHTPDFTTHPMGCQTPSNAIFGVNADCLCGHVVETETQSWSGIKSLYR